MLPHYLSIGVSYERFMDSCPKELEPFDKAHKKKIIEQDEMQHFWWGNYGISALMVAIDHCMNGRKATLKYLSEPLLSKNMSGSEQLTEERKQAELNAFILENEKMRNNWKKNHRKPDDE